ncbi:hypothetical protein QYF61_023093 [Mycteria americana]|uniref:Uncharacterized protein n=1 Tax=Mycteria americana TaxID=33587 RepID=A0AAN7S546_MYCAM|nr:hypothetical protein QYF61_023093 [Mycteria americana]
MALPRGICLINLINYYDEMTGLAKQPQLSQPLLIGEVLQPPDHLCGPPLDLLKQVHVSCTGVPQDWMQYSRPALNPLIAQPISMFRIATTQVQDLALDLVELHEVCTGPPMNHTTQLGVIRKLAESLPFFPFKKWGLCFIFSIVYLNFIKTFNSLSCKILIDKMLMYGLDEQTVRWFENWLNGQAQWVVISGTKSS